MDPCLIIDIREPNAMPNLLKKVVSVCLSVVLTYVSIGLEPYAAFAQQLTPFVPGPGVGVTGFGVSGSDQGGGGLPSEAEKPLSSLVDLDLESLSQGLGHSSQETIASGHEVTTTKETYLRRSRSLPPNLSVAKLEDPPPSEEATCARRPG